MEALSFAQLITPVLFVVGAIYLLGPMLPLNRRWARGLVFIVVWSVIGRYLEWRLFDTVMPAQGQWYEVGWVWFCFAIELFALFDAGILYLTFLRTTDRRAEADLLEQRLRALDDSEVPSVDIYIPTYNESLDVLEKTITGALCLDYPNFQVWVLDDGRRHWLKEFCEVKGIGYLTRTDNAHAKAGNINHALTKTNAEFIAIFDADFIPQRDFLMRTVGFFSDPTVGIVQVPHAFYNHDPMQANLALRKTLPDDQRFFFEAVLPSRDGWDAAFCCGSNSVTRRAALRAVGDALPTDSITEDMLLSLILLRKGYITRYLCERLAYGLAPESFKAFFIQRQRWARGAIQMLYLSSGPFGPGLTLIQRLLFLPTHWISQGLMIQLSIIAPLVFLWTGLLPCVNVTAEAVLYYLLPMILAVAGGTWVYAPKQYFPFASQVLGTFQSFKILPPALKTVIQPFGHGFKVTPKGRSAAESNYEVGIFWASAVLMCFTVVGLVINTKPEWQVVTKSGLLPTVAIWSAVNVIILFLVCMMSLPAPVRRTEERFQIEEPIWIFSSIGTLISARTRDLSLSGVALVADAGRIANLGEKVSLYITEVGFVRGTVVRCAERNLAIKFDLPPCVERDLLIRKLFTGGMELMTVNASTWSATFAMLMAIWSNPTGTRAKLPESLSEPSPVEKLPALSFVIAPRIETRQLAVLSAQRRKFAA